MERSQEDLIEERRFVLAEVDALRRLLKARLNYANLLARLASLTEPLPPLIIEPQEVIEP